VLAEIVSVAVIYYLTGRLGRLVAPPPGVATVVWPPSGIALAALLILGNRVWPGVWLGAFLANNWAAFNLSDARGTLTILATGMSIDIGALLQALARAALIRRLIGQRNPFERVRDTLTFIGISLPVCLIASSTGALSLFLGGFLPRDAALDRWSNWWIGDTGGLLVIAPVILTCWYQGWPRWNALRRREALLLFGTVTLFAMAIFLGWHPVGPHKYPTDLLLLPLIACVAVRFTQREVTLLVLLVLAIALVGTVNGRGPYASNEVWTTLPVLQAFIGMLSMLSLSIGAAIAERKRTEEALQASEHWLKESQRISRVGSYVLDLQAGSWTHSEALAEIFGIEGGYPRSVEDWAQFIPRNGRPCWITSTTK
jgi:integral membrane sensor domain MASE1